MPDQTEPQSPAPRCIYLTCKSMQVWGEDFENDPEFQNGMVEFWCTKTMKATGPDDEVANLKVCCNPQRPCYQEF